MTDWSQDSVHPLGPATPASRVSDHDSITAESRWSELYRLLLAPGTTAWALAPTSTPNRPVKERAGDAVSLISEAEHAGAGHSVWAVVAPVRSDLLVIDLDRCASQVWPQLRDVAGEHSAEVAYLAASGSPDSIHVALSCATIDGEHAIKDFLGRLREHLGLSASRIDVHPPGHLLRLPGSASLKPEGRHCVPVDEDLRPITAVAAAARLREVLGGQSAPIQGAFTRHCDRWCVQVPAALFREGLEVEVRRRDGLTKVVALGAITHTRGDRVLADFVEVAGAADRAGTAAISTPPLRLITDGEETTDLQWQSPRAWRPRQALAAEQWHVLNDSTTPDRSAAATAAAWVLWQVGIRSFAAARWYYQHLPAFSKFRNRDAERQSKRSSCAAHWQAIADRARAHRPPLSPADRDVLDEALAAIATWDDPALVAAGIAVIRRFADGHGLRSRPIAKRDLASWLYVCDSRAHLYLRQLADLGLIVCARDWADGPPWQATLWHLGAPADIYRGNGTHDVTQLTGESTPLHPLWGMLGFDSYQVWSTAARSLGPSVTTRELALSCGLASGDRTHGVLRVVRALHDLGLFKRVGSGRGTRWSAISGQAAVDAAADECGATTRARELLARIVGERKVWHAEGPRERARSVSGLAALRSRLTHEDVTGRPQGTLFIAADSSDRLQVRRRTRRTITGGEVGRRRLDVLPP